MPNHPNLPLMFHASFRSNIYRVPLFLFLSLQAKMDNLPYFKTKPQHVCSGCSSCFKSVSCSFKSTCFLCLCFYRSIVFHLNPLSVHLLYFLSFSFLGFGILKALKPRTYPSFTPRNIDLIFTSVSATTVSSMSTVEMEVFSNTQLIILTILMFIGGEVFTSMVGLHLGRWFKPKKINNKVDTTSSTSSPNGGSIPYSSPRPPSRFQSRQWEDQIELEMGTNISKSETNDQLQIQTEAPDINIVDQDLKYQSIRFLSFLVLGFLALINVLGIGSLLVYLAAVSSAREVLRSKGIKLTTFSIFTIISTFTNCGFVPTNENMMVFSKNSVLLLILIPQVLFGNTLFPPCLRFSIWVLGKLVRRFESSCNYLLKNSKEIGYHHLLPAQHSLLLVVTVIGFILLQFILFCAMEWKSTALSGLNTFQKVVGVLFQTVNSRHTGETIVDLSTISAAVLALFVVMMYLPPYTSFVPIKAEQNESNSCPVQHQYGRKKKRRRQVVLENLILSQLSYIAIFVILICITESKSMKDDPLNFNVFAIVVEVVSAYGSVGFSIGYSCERQLKPDSSCKDKWYGFSGKWSDEGKIILIVVMLFGRLKKFNMDGGRAWKLL